MWKFQTAIDSDGILLGAFGRLANGSLASVDLIFLRYELFFVKSAHGCPLLVATT